MDAATVFGIGVVTTLGIALGMVGYLRRPLRKVLIELCGNEQRAEFWTVFTAVTLAIVPVIFALGWRPSAEQGAGAVFELADQMKWGLIGMMGSVLVLGWVIGQSIVRWESRLRK